MAEFMNAGSNHSTALSKAVSAAHAATTSIVALLLLSYSSWPVPEGPEVSSERGKHSDQQLDDSRNPIINGRNTLANALSAWETAYLLYDTYTMIELSRKRNSLRTNFAALHLVAQESPVILAHHVLLATAFLVLQSYISAGKEKGLWVITAFMLMNSSTPLMHARWWMRQRTGKPSNFLDAAFLAIFAGSRFGVTVWVLRKYGKYHGIGALQAYRQLRKECQTGTAMLVALNGAWWAILALKFLKRNIGRRTH